jgi:hypothetical protein
MRNKHQGKCHCGNIRYLFQAAFSIQDMPVRGCGCSYCVKSGARYTSDPEGSLSVTIRDQDQVTCYQFGHRTADFHLCRICGGGPFVTSQIDGRTFAVLNANTLDEAKLIKPEDTPASDFDGEEVMGRLDRRKQRWIPDVSFHAEM